MKVDLRAVAAPAFYTALDAPYARIIVIVQNGSLARVLLEAKELKSAREAFPRLTRDDAKCARAADALRRAIAGRRVPLSLSDSGASPFHAAVWEAAARIPFGRVASYAQLAAAVGRPRAARAVGNAMGRNPLPILVPCHRVVGSDRTLGGFGGGLPLKKRMLAFEGVPLNRNRVDPGSYVAQIP